MYSSKICSQYTGPSSISICLCVILQLARLSDTDMKVVKNMKLIEGSDSRSASTGTFSLMFDSEKVIFFYNRLHAYVMVDSRYWLKLRSINTLYCYFHTRGRPWLERIEQERKRHGHYLSSIPWLRFVQDHKRIVHVMSSNCKASESHHKIVSLLALAKNTRILIINETWL